MVGQLFHGGTKLLQGFTIILGPGFQLIAAPYNKMLVPESVLSCRDSLLICYSFRDSALWGSKKMHSF
jgi:hypothetical protein